MVTAGEGACGDGDGDGVKVSMCAAVRNGSILMKHVELSMHDRIFGVGISRNQKSLVDGEKMTDFWKHVCATIPCCSYVEMR